MPNTSRRTKRPPKRTQVTDENGWTHVTSGGNVRRVMRSRPDSTGTSDPSFEPVLAPAEAPARLTITQLQTQFREHSEKWEGSETWVKLAGVLEKKLRERGSEQPSGTSQSEPASGPVDAIVCIGLGSPSGFLRDGWTDRRSVSMYQLAALVSIKDTIAGEFYILTLFLLSSELAFEGSRALVLPYSLALIRSHTYTSTSATIYTHNPSAHI
ncbi:hypothetical protein PENANT_c036G00622 [Penicillium antarcticum]|uniref:SRR1-like domain-containing protein n=1 Tax=Penicillium antarcticum TaxID=416450 RepID=A0A1V6PTK8_9EURO|nr:hypothetical protein PENANT_c036G00622 [Penicillium antarcticum]